MLSEYITSIVSDKPNDLFFFNQKLLHEYSKKNSELESAKESVPSSNYFYKILTFWDIHHKKGQIIHGTSKDFLLRGEWRTLLTL